MDGVASSESERLLSKSATMRDASPDTEPDEIVRSLAAIASPFLEAVNNDSARNLADDSDMQMSEVGSVRPSIARRSNPVESNHRIDHSDDASALELPTMIDFDLRDNEDGMTNIYLSGAGLYSVVGEVIVSPAPLPCFAVEASTKLASRLAMRYAASNWLEQHLDRPVHIQRIAWKRQTSQATILYQPIEWKTEHGQHAIRLPEACWCIPRNDLALVEIKREAFRIAVMASLQADGLKVIAYV